MSNSEKPLIIQSDASILLDVHNPAADRARQEIACFCELEKSPEHIHTYRVTPISLWNAAAAGIGGEEILCRLEHWSKYQVPGNVTTIITDTISRFGKIILLPVPDSNETFLLQIEDEFVRREIESRKSIEKFLDGEVKVEESRLLGACGNDQALLKRIKPYANLVRANRSGDPIIIPDGSVYVTEGTDRRSSGTHYTPKSLTEPIVQYTLEPLVYEGPAEGKPEDEWNLKTPAEPRRWS